MNYVYLYPVFEGIEINQVPVAVPCKWRWIAQPSFDLVNYMDNLFTNKDSIPCWVFQADKELTGFEVAPEKYPNGIEIVDSSVNDKQWNDCIGV